MMADSGKPRDSVGNTYRPVTWRSAARNRRQLLDKGCLGTNGIAAEMRGCVIWGSTNYQYHLEFDLRYMIL